MSDQSKTPAFDQLLRPHMQDLYRLAFRLAGNKSEAEDLFQDVLTKVLLRLDDLTGIEVPRTWLNRVMVNHFIDNRRKYSRQRMLMVEEGHLPDGTVDSLQGSGSPDQDAQREDNIIQLETALAKLSDEHRLLILLHDVEGYKLTEIQDFTGVPVGTIKSRLHRARARLRDFLVLEGTIL
jgi:RNA polymerase sigma factor (sigma-70 family)